ncbi:unnamed protein product [Amoebophrya sp. A120]|nr:unnamed protein product [Amoebophrya sp. A120]|eukprot:GSA120T00024201001.1
MSCRTSAGLIAHKTVENQEREKFKAVWRRYEAEFENETKSRLLMVLVQSGMDFELGHVSCHTFQPAQKLGSLPKLVLQLSSASSASSASERDEGLRDRSDVAAPPPPQVVGPSGEAQSAKGPPPPPAENQQAAARSLESIEADAKSRFQKLAGRRAGGTNNDRDMKMEKQKFANLMDFMPSSKQATNNAPSASSRNAGAAKRNAAPATVGLQLHDPSTAPTRGTSKPEHQAASTHGGKQVPPQVVELSDSSADLSSPDDDDDDDDAQFRNAPASASKAAGHSKNNAGKTNTLSSSTTAKTTPVTSHFSSALRTHEDDPDYSQRGVFAATDNVVSPSDWQSLPLMGITTGNVLASISMNQIEDDELAQALAASRGEIDIIQPGGQQHPAIEHPSLDFELQQALALSREGVDEAQRSEEQDLQRAMQESLQQAGAGSNDGAPGAPALVPSVPPFADEVDQDAALQAALALSAAAASGSGASTSSWMAPAAGIVTRDDDLEAALRLSLQETTLSIQPQPGAAGAGASTSSSFLHVVQQSGGATSSTSGGTTRNVAVPVPPPRPPANEVIELDSSSEEGADNHNHPRAQKRRKPNSTTVQDQPRPPDGPLAAPEDHTIAERRRRAQEAAERRRQANMRNGL